MNIAPQKTSGYSLIEVLIAFAIMMMVLAALLPAQTKILASTISLQQRQLAFEYAQSRLAPLGMTAPLTSSTTSGTYQDTWNWSEDISENLLSNAEHPLFDVEITITTIDGHPLAELFAVRQGAK